MSVIDARKQKCFDTLLSGGLGPVKYDVGSVTMEQACRAAVHSARIVVPAVSIATYRDLLFYS